MCSGAPARVNAESMTAREEELVELLVEVPNSDDLNACRDLAAKRLHAQLLKLAAGYIRTAARRQARSVDVVVLDDDANVSTLRPMPV